MRRGNLVSPARRIKAIAERRGRPGLIAFILCASAVAHAQNAIGLRDLMQARNYGMGAAYRALGVGTESVDGNPAAMSLRKRYEIDIAGVWDQQTKFGFLNTAAYDSRTSELAAGVSYHFVSIGRGPLQRYAHVSTVALAASASDAIHFGLAGHYVVESGALSRNGITLDAGMAVRLADAITIAISAHNLIDVHNPDLPRYYAAGVGYAKGALTLAADLRADFSTSPRSELTPGAGIEYIVGGSFPLRAGYTYDSLAQSHFVSGGLGMVREGGGVDFAYRQEIGGSEQHLIALTFKIQL